MALVFSAMLNAISPVMDRELGFLRELLVAPVRRVVGRCLGGATRRVPSLVEVGIALVLGLAMMAVAIARFPRTE